MARIKGEEWEIKIGDHAFFSIRREDLRILNPGVPRWLIELKPLLSAQVVILESRDRAPHGALLSRRPASYSPSAYL